MWKHLLAVTPVSQWASGSVSQRLIVSDLEIAIASPSFATLFITLTLELWWCLKLVAITRHRARVAHVAPWYVTMTSVSKVTEKSVATTPVPMEQPTSKTTSVPKEKPTSKMASVAPPKVRDLNSLSSLSTNCNQCIAMFNLQVFGSMSKQGLHCRYISLCVRSQTKSSLVWKKSSNYWRTFPNQIQFCLENNCVKFGGKLIPNQIQFSLEKNAEHFSRQKSQTDSCLVLDKMLEISTDKIPNQF